MISPVKIWRRQKEIRNRLGEKGIIISWTIVYVAGRDFKKYAPYPVAVIKMDSGDKITCQLVDFDQKELKIGQTVIVTLRKVREGSSEDVIAYGLKAKPVSRNM